MLSNVARILSIIGVICLLLTNCRSGSVQARTTPPDAAPPSAKTENPKLTGLHQYMLAGKSGVLKFTRPVDEELSKRVVVIPHYWVSIWFQLALAGGMAMSVIAGGRWRIYNNRQRRRQLTVLVEKRTQELERRWKASECLHEVILRLNQNLPVQESLEYITSQVGVLLQADWVGLFQLNEEGQIHLLASYQQGNSRKRFTPDDIAPGGLLHLFANQLRAVQAPTQVSIDDLRTGILCTDNGSLAGYKRAVIHPVLLANTLYGGLAALFRDRSHLTHDEQELLGTFCEQVALAIDNERLREEEKELAVISERNRLARDLHDAVTQTMFSASLIAETLPTLLKDDPQEGLELLQELRQLTRGALAEMRTLLMELRPAVMVDAKLSDLLRQLAEAVTGKKGVVVQFNATEITPLPEDVHICLYRIAQEALANVVKHSRANRIAVVLVEQRPVDENHCRQVILEVCDNGRGFDQHRIPPDHFGLKNMRERAQVAGALLDVISSPGAGTTVRAIWTGKGE